MRGCRGDCSLQAPQVYVPAVGRSGHCSEHQHDQFAYGDFWGMRNYFDVFPVMHYLHAEMKRNPRYYSGKGPLPANQTTWMAPTTEKYLGHRLMLVRGSAQPAILCEAHATLTEQHKMSPVSGAGPRLLHRAGPEKQRRLQLERDLQMLIDAAAGSYVA